jgi:hypothetical protein
VSRMSSSVVRGLHFVVGVLVLALVVVFSTFGPGVGSASAGLAPGFGSAGAFGTGEFPVPKHAGGIAVDDATGNILVPDAQGLGRGLPQVLVYAPDLNPGGTATLLTQFAISAGVDQIINLAIDQSSHAVYVTESAPVNRIERFVSDGAPVPTYTADPTFTSPLLVSYSVPIAVDPTTHDLLVAAGDHVNRYTSNGIFVRSFDGSDSPDGKFTRVSDLAVGATKTYVLNLTGDPVSGDGVSRVAQFDAQGVYERTLQATDTPTAVGVDPIDRPIVVARTGAGRGGAQLFTIDDGAVGSVGTITPAPALYTGRIAADGSGSGRVYVAVTGSPYLGSTPDNGVGVLVAGAGVRLDSVTSSDPEVGHLTGLVNPEGSAVSAHVEYCSRRDPCATDASAAWQSGPDIAAGSGAADVSVDTTITGLLPHTGYTVRLVTVNAAGTVVQTRPKDFQTADAAPVVSTGNVSDLSSDAASVTGTVAPLGIQATYYFEYGETTAYGSRVPDSDSAGVAGDGFGPRSVRRSLSGLKAGTLYHYRLVGLSAVGRIAGADRTFTTGSAGAALRGYEMVSRVDKQGVPIDPGFAGVRTSDDGDRLMYGTAKSVLPGGDAATIVPRVLSERSTTAWTNTTLDLPLDNLLPHNELFFGVLAVSSDVRRALVLSRKKLTDDAVQGGWNLYIRDPGAQAPAPEFTLVATDDLLAVLASTNSPFKYVGTSDDLRTTVFTISDKMYEAVLGQGVTLVSRMPDGTAAALPVSDPDNAQSDPHQISADGSRIYFNVGNGGGPLYLRQNGTTTIPISVSHRPGAPATPVGAVLIGASPDGRYVEFTTYGFGAVDGLTPSAPDGPGIYRYDVVDNAMTFLAVDPSISRTVPRPERGEILFEITDPMGIYLAHDATVTKIADLTDPSTPPVTRGSDNGRFFTFVSTTKLTSYDNTGHQELYLYDSDTGDLSCPSCRTDGGASTGEVQMGTEPGSNQTILARYKPRPVLDDGTVFFDTPDPLVGADVNGTRDVYSYRNGRVAMISRGKLPTSSTFAEATPDGSSVFFITDDQLVGQDQDTTTDMYVARLGGGIAEQSPKPGPAPCGGSECREAATGPIASDPPSSQHVDGAESKAAATPKAKIAILSSSLTATTLRIVVQVSGRGQIRVTGPRVTTTSKTAGKAGKYTIKVPLTKKTRTARKANHKLKIAVNVALRPPFAAVATAKLSRTLGK